MKARNPVSMSSSNMHTTDVNMEASEDKLFKKFIMRKNIEDSIFDESRDSLFSGKKSRKAVIISGSGISVNSRQTSTGNLFSSPKRAQTNMLIRALPPKGSTHIRKPESRVIGKSVIYGDKVNKKQVKSTHPLALFVSFYNSGRYIQEAV